MSENFPRDLLLDDDFIKRLFFAELYPVWKSGSDDFIVVDDHWIETRHDMTGRTYIESCKVGNFLLKEGLVERKWVKGLGYYRLTEAGARAAVLLEVSDEL